MRYIWIVTVAATRPSVKKVCIKVRAKRERRLSLLDRNKILTEFNWKSYFYSVTSKRDHSELPETIQIL